MKKIKENKRKTKAVKDVDTERAVREERMSGEKCVMADEMVQ